MANISDDFNRANESLGPPWDVAAGTGVVQSNRMTFTAESGSGLLAAATVDPASTDVEVSAELEQTSAIDNGGGLILRYSGDDDTCLVVALNAAGTVSLFEFNGSSFTSIASESTTWAIDTPRTVVARDNGSTVTVTVGSDTDVLSHATAYKSGQTGCGVRLRDTWFADDFAVTDQNAATGRPRTMRRRLLLSA